MTQPDRTNPPRSIGRSILAVAAGLIFIMVTHNGMDALMHLTGVFPPMFQPMSTRLWILALGYRVVFSIIGCYLTAYMAPARPLNHAMIVGQIGVILSLIGVLATWNKGPEFGPKWYPIALVFISLPCALVGGRLRERQLK